MPTQFQLSIDFLSANILRNIVLLKMLRLYPEAIQCHYDENQDGAGVLLLLPTQASTYDRRSYPTTRYVVLLSASSSTLIPQLLTFVPHDNPLIFKLLGDADRRAVAQAFALRRATAFISYTAPGSSHFAPFEAVFVSSQVDEQCFALYATQGYSREEITGYFASGAALSFTIYRAALPVASCFAYPNFGNVHASIGLAETIGLRRFVIMEHWLA
jgi:hypothetical protein